MRSGYSSARGRPHPGVHRVRGEARHRVDLVDDDTAVVGVEAVDAREPLAAASDSKASAARRRTSFGDLLRHVGRAAEVDVGLGEVLRLEVVEGVVVVDGDLAHLGRARPGRAVALEHRALDLAPGDALLDEDLRVVLARDLDRGLERRRDRRHG